jgi:hypothetical protein
MVILLGGKTVPAGGATVSLVSFHRSLILVAIAFCFMYAGWELRAWLGDPSAGTPALAGIFALLGLALTFYLVRLATILKLDD